VLWKKTWRPETVMALVGGIMAVFCGSAAAIELLRRAGVAGFHTMDSTGSVVVQTLGMDGGMIVVGILFFKFNGVGWREILGLNKIRLSKQIQWVVIALMFAMPIMYGLELLSLHVLEKIGWQVEEQRAVELVLAAKSTGMKIYFCVFAILVAPAAEEILFRGLLFSSIQKLRTLSLIKLLRMSRMPTFAGWATSRRICRASGYIGISFLFALIHENVPTFLPLFVFALVLTWLYETTEGLLAPIMAHGIFNASNLVYLFVQLHRGQ
jgi:membrane protease YdiL (CAAX protease family)